LEESNKAIEESNKTIPYRTVNDSRSITLRVVPSELGQYGTRAHDVFGYLYLIERQMIAVR